MKKFETPAIVVEELNVMDVITASGDNSCNSEVSDLCPVDAGEF